MRFGRVGLGGIAVAMLAVVLHNLFRKDSENGEAPDGNSVPGQGKDTFRSIPNRPFTIGPKNGFSDGSPVHHPILIEDYSKRFPAPSFISKNLTEMRDFLESRNIQHHFTQSAEEQSIDLEAPSSPTIAVRYVYDGDGKFLSMKVEADRDEFEERLDDYAQSMDQWIIMGFLEGNGASDRLQITANESGIDVEGLGIFPDNFKLIIQSAIRTAVIDPYWSGRAFDTVSGH